MSNSVSQPYCPECHEPMVKTADGFWFCKEHSQSVVNEKEETRSECVRVLLKPSEYAAMMISRGEQTVSSYGRDAIIERVERDQAAET